jgi:hypothetical protein
MNYKLTSLKRVISKVLTDLDIQEENIRTSDMIEWAGEALLKIGGFSSLIIRTTGREDIPLLALSNFQVELPHDFHSLIQISYGYSITGPFYPMRYATGTFEHNSESVTSTVVDVADIPTSMDVVSLAMELYNLSYADALEKINTEDNTRAILSSLLLPSHPDSTSDTSTSDFIYTIRGGYLKTNQETGYIMMTYQAIPTDLDGYPLIPDNESFVEAVYWYIVMKLYYPKWVQGQIRDAVYYEAKRSYNYYCKQAYGNIMMPDRGQMESIKNVWLRLYPNINEYDTNFSNIGQQEFVYNHATE